MDAKRLSILLLLAAPLTAAFAAGFVGRTEGEQRPNLLRRYISEMPPDVKAKLAATYRKMAEDRKTEAGGVEADLYGVEWDLDEIARTKVSRLTHARVRHSNLEKKRDEGMAEVEKAGRDAASTIRDAAGQELVLGALKAFDLKFASEMGSKAIAIEEGTDAAAAKKLIRAAASVADLVSDGQARVVVDLAISGYEVAEGGRKALVAQRGLTRLQPLYDRAFDFETARMVLPKEREDLAYRLNGLTSSAKQYEDIAAKLERGEIPDSLPLPPEVQEVLYPHARLSRYSARMNPVPSPRWLSQGEPGGIKFSPTNLDSSIFQLDLDALYYDEDQGNLVLIGDMAAGHVPMNSDLVASALLLAAQGGDPWFSLDALNARDWDDASGWSAKEISAKYTNSQLVARLAALQAEGKIIRRELADGNVALYATLDALDPELYDRLRREKEIGVHLAYSHEFLRYTEAGRVLFEADKALKQAVRGATLTGNAVRPAALNALLSDKPFEVSGRGDFAPVVVSSRGPSGLVGVADLSMILELTARFKGESVDDKKTRVEAFDEMTAKFNGNKDGVRDRILESSYSIGQLRQFYKAYFAAKSLMDRDPGLRPLVLASVQVPVRDCLPDVYYEPPVLALHVCPEFFQGGACTEGRRVGVRAGFGFSGGISFAGTGPNAPVMRDAVADPALSRAAALGREAARNSAPGVTTTDGQSYIRVSLFPEPHARRLGEIDLKGEPPPEVKPDPPPPPVPRTSPLPALLAIACAAAAAFWARRALRALPASPGTCAACLKRDRARLLGRAAALGALAAASVYFAARHFLGGSHGQ